MAKKMLMLAFDFPPNWGGVATYGWELAHEFQNLGYDVDVLSPATDEIPESPFTQNRIKLPKVGILAIPIFYLKLLRHLQKNSYDVIYCNLWLPEGVAAYLALKTLKLNTPLAVAVHAMEIVNSSENVKKRIRQKLNFLKQRVFHRAQAIFCVSRFTKDLLLNQVRLESSQVHVVANGANPDIFSPQAKKTEFPTLLTSCRLQANKGIDQVIKSLPALIKKHPKIEYRITGSGPDRDRLEKLVSMMGVSDHVKFLGKIALEQLVQEYSQAHLFVMLSRRQAHHVEGFGLVFLEAALCGTASLGGMSGGVPDAIIDNKTGWLVDPYHSEIIENKLVELLSQPEVLQEMGEKARQYTLTHRTWKQSANEISDILEGQL